jgi:hypothetical protein
MEWGTAGRVVGEIRGAHHHLAVANLAQRARILRGYADRFGAFLGQPSIVKDQHACGRRMQGQQALDAGLIERLCVPGGIGEQVLQALGRGSRHRGRDGIRGLVGQVREQPREVAFPAVSAGVSSEERRKRF